MPSQKNVSLVYLSLMLAFSCTNDKSDSITDGANVRVVHLSPDAPNVDVYVNGISVGGDDVIFPSASNYVAVPAAEQTVEFAPSVGSYDDALPVALTASLENGVSYTTIAHGYLNPANGNNAFAITSFRDELSGISDGNLRLNIIHAAPLASYAQVDLWNITDSENPVLLVTDLGYEAAVATELPTGVAFLLGIDVDNDANGFIEVTIDASYGRPCASALGGRFLARSAATLRSSATTC